ncbi:MAG TPA: amidophosphoribosyltransferase [Acidobacteriota bacterium]|nr:amidophosphoribosyltransferase [Acidobacteriota bacterium]
MSEEDKLHDQCGIFGIWNHADAARYTYLGLYGQQHRGQESCGITSTDGENMFTRKGMGLVAQYFDEAKIIELAGYGAIGHVRYSTTGSSQPKNAQPIYFDTHRGPISLAHNGNLVNVNSVRDTLSRAGTIFMTSSDSEVILHLIAQSAENDIVSAIVDALHQVKGAYSVVFLTPTMLLAVRDPHGFRPLVMGRLGGSTVFASETTAFDLINAEFVKELEPGEVVFVGKENEQPQSIFPFPQERQHQCIFEHVYFARPDSRVFGTIVHGVRRKLGENIARENAGVIEADLVVPVPDGGNYIALGFSQESGIPFEIGLVRNHYVGRTFIEPEQGIRDFGVKVKLNPIRPVIEGKRIALVDDSIVRGTTSRKIIQILRQAGAAEVHYLVGSPPYVSPCYYGIDTPEKEDLIAANLPVEDIRKSIGADSLHYLSLEGLLQSVDPDREKYCISCFTAHYPVQTTKDADDQLNLWHRRELNGDGKD